jgi:phosphoenolpyruvate-protein phosphotransferase (PTS system enzyme I)
MEIIQGNKVFGGIAKGKIKYFEKKEQQVRRTHITDWNHEVLRFSQAKESASIELCDLYEQAVKQVGEEDAAIFEIHKMMLEDGDFLDAIKTMIQNQQVNAEFAVATIGDNFASMFASMEDEYMKARAVDVQDIANRLIKCLKGDANESMLLQEPVILVAEDLTPSETLQLDKSKILAFVTKLGSSNSHTAILARTMNIPSIIGVEIQRDWDTKEAILDGNQGILYLEPDEKTRNIMDEKLHIQTNERQKLKQLKGQETITLDGRQVKLYANGGSLGDCMLALQNDAEGIGLFRSEFLYLEQDHFPTEEEQFQIYKAVAESMAGKKVIIRTMDIGADKQIDYFQLEKEENPALGYRAIRICLNQPDIFKTQLRALFRASMYGNISIMYPMIISKKEIDQIKEIVQEVKAELTMQGVPYREKIEQGIMIETPAAVMISDILAKEVDFFSIGTNDLTQYTLAIDRQNPKLDTFYDAHHEGLLRMIDMVVKHAHQEHIWVGICGELGADQVLCKRFLQMGIDELSVSPSLILPLRKHIRQLNMNE